MTTTPSLEQRIAKLEARVRRSNMLICGMVAVFVGVMVMGMGEPTTQPAKQSSPPEEIDAIAHDVIFTKHLAVVNDDGEPRVVLSVKDFAGNREQGSIRLLDQEGNTRFSATGSRLRLTSEGILSSTGPVPMAAKKVMMAELLANPGGAKARFNFVAEEVAKKQASTWTEDEMMSVVQSEASIGYFASFDTETKSRTWGTQLELPRPSGVSGISARVTEMQSCISLFDNNGKKRASFGATELRMGQATVKHPESSLLLFDPSGNVIANLP